MKKAFILAMLISLSGCATQTGMGSGYGSNYNPIIDAPQDATFYKNLTECRELAKNVEANKNDQVLQEALAGAVVGALTGAIVSGNRYGITGYGARVGTLAGTGNAVTSSVVTGKQVIINCMIARGYKVLG